MPAARMACSRGDRHGITHVPPSEQCRTQYYNVLKHVGITFHDETGEWIIMLPFVELQKDVCADTALSEVLAPSSYIKLPAESSKGDASQA